MVSYKYDWDDLLIMPCELSDIDSRQEIDIKYPNGKLPLYVSPMDTVVDVDNARYYLELGFEVCLPRDILYSENNDLIDCFFSYGLDEIIRLLENDEVLPDKVLIDIANGHLKKLYYTIKMFKNLHPDKTLMVGNVANPLTYKSLSQAGADIVRIGIGNGGGCLTTQQTGVGYPMASLVKECRDIKNEFGLKSKILADGGFQKYSDVIKSLAIGSDSVMLGSILNKTIESSGDNYLKLGKFNVKVGDSFSKFLYKRGYKVYKKFRGMSTKEVQKKWNRSVIKTSEGVVRYRPVEYTLSGWVSNFSDYLKSNMSYSNAINLESFVGKVTYNFITNSSFNRFNK